VGISFLFLHAHHWGSSIVVGGNVGGIFKLVFSQSGLDSFSGEDEVCKVSWHVSYQLLVVEHRQRIYHNRDHLPLSHGRDDLGC